jgi:hypothetical protein
MLFLTSVSLLETEPLFRYVPPRAYSYNKVDHLHIYIVYMKGRGLAMMGIDITRFHVETNVFGPYDLTCHGLAN